MMSQKHDNSPALNLRKSHIDRFSSQPAIHHTATSFYISGLESLHSLSSRHYASLEEAYEFYISEGCQIFGMETGLVSMLGGICMKIEAVQSPNDELTKGQEFDIPDTICQAVVKQSETIFYSRLSDTELKELPAHQVFAFDSYIGAPITRQGKVIGTLSFWSKKAQVEEKLSEKRAVIDLMAQGLSKIIQLKESDDDLRKSELKFRTLIERIPLGISLASTNGIIKYVNEAFCDIIGYSLDELQGLNWGELTYPEDLAQNIHSVQDVLNGIVPSIEFEKRYLHKRGHLLWCRLMVSSFWDEEIQDQTIIAVIEDITEKKITQGLLKHSETKYKSLFQHAPIGVVMINHEGRFRFVNPQYQKITGYNETELLNITFQEITHPDDLKKNLTHVHSVQQKKNKIAQYEKRYIRKDGSEVWCQLVIGDLPSFNQEEGYMVAMIKDISEEKQSKQKIEKLLKMISEGEKVAKMGTIVWDIRTNETEASPGIMTLFEYDEDLGANEFFQKGMSMVHPDDLPDLLNAVAAAASQEEPVDYDYRIILKDGSIKWIRTTGGTMLDEHHMIRTFQDVTAEINQREELAKANRELEELVYSVSHDLRAPIRHVSGYAELLFRSVKEKMSADETAFLKNVIDSGKRLGVMIDELLQYSRSRNKELSKEWVKVEDILDPILGLFERETIERGIEWNIQSMPELYVDQNMIEKLFLNLISNAVKYSGKEAQSVIDIYSTSADNAIRITVKDNGAGFDMAYANKLFSVFHRLHKRSEFEGTGIGLANAQRIVQRHGGKIWAYGEEGKGAEFHFTLPFPPHKN